MSLSIDLTTHGKQLQQVYDKIISGSEDTSWAVFSYDKGASNELKVQSQGGGELDEIVDEFSDGRISYGFVRVEDPNTKLNKFVLIGWCGEGVPEHKKGLFHSHFLAVAKFLKGYHVQITARSEADLDPATIMRKVADSSGSKYSEIMSKFETSPHSKRGPPISPSVSAAFGRSPSYTVKKDDDGWGDAPQITSRAPVTVKSAYQPTKVDMAALRAQKSDTTSGDRPEVIKGSYVPIGKVDIAAIRAQAQQQSSPPPPRNKPEPVGTTGYTPIQLPKPKPLGGGPAITKFGPRVTSGGTTAPMPVAPARESKALGGASKNFGTDSSGKTPSQLWAERKARERGVSGSASVIPNIAPQTPLPVAKPNTSPSPPSGGYVEDSAEVIGKPVSGGVAAMRERFAKQSLEEDRPPISPGGVVRPSGARFSPREEEEEEEGPMAGGPPPPVAMASKPGPGRSYQSLDHVVAAGAGAGIGLGVGALAGRAMHHDEEEEPQEEEEEQHYEPEPEPEEEEYVAPPPPPPAARPAVQQSWDTSHDDEPTEEEEDHIATRQQSQFHAEQENEEEDELPQHHDEDEEPTHAAETGAQSSKTAVVLFDYEAQEENELHLTEGQIITNVEFIDDGWWAGEDSNGNGGLFPSNYVEIQESQHPSNIPSVPLSTPHGHEDDHPASTQPAAEEDEEGGETAIAEYDYEAQEENELSFPEGARITNIERVDDNWWAGEYQGNSGLFPSNYVKAQ